MVPAQITRRRAIAGVGAAIVGSTAGCSLFGGPRYTLKSRPENGADVVDRFEWRPAANAFHHRDGYVERLADDLRETGSVESVEAALVDERGTGEEGFVPSYVDRDGTFYRVRVRSEPVTLERWTVWMEPLAELPDGVEYTTTPEAGLSELDSSIVRRSVRAAVLSELDGGDHAAQRAYRRGIVFFEPLDPSESALVPNPPFEYALVEPEAHSGPDELALRLRVAEEPVETVRYVHDLEPVASSREELVAHLREEHVAVRYGRDDLSEEGRDVLAASTDLTGHTEEAPLSEAFESIVADLGLDGVELPDGREVASWLRYYEYDGDCYSASLRISDL